MYEVGQILFLLINKSRKIAPVQVVEQIVRKSIDGEEVSYVVQLPNSEKTKIDLSKLECEVFTDSDLIRKSMIEKAISAIDKLVGDSIQISSNAFDCEVAKLSEPLSSDFFSASNDGSSSDESAMIDLGNGQRGKIDISKLENII